jgi:hypothetical protein
MLSHFSGQNDTGAYVRKDKTTGLLPGLGTDCCSDRTHGGIDIGCSNFNINTVSTDITVIPGTTPDRIELELVDELQVVIENSGVIQTGSSIDLA